jgi:hypothetical protein
MALEIEQKTAFKQKANLGLRILTAVGVSVANLKIVWR